MSLRSSSCLSSRILASASLTCLLALGSLCCGKSSEHETADKPPPAPISEAPSAKRPPGPVGKIVGAIKLVGEAPEMPFLRRGSDPKCDTGKVRAGTIFVGASGGLANVVIRIKPGTVTAWTPSTKISVDQTDCLYVPRVQTGVRGQKVEVQNSDPTTHNVHARNLPLGRRQGNGTIVNLAQPSGVPVSFTLGDEPVVKLKCDYHGWMQGFIVVSDNPYSAVTAKDGSFTLHDVPAGKQTLQLWHEYYGVKEAQIEVTADGVATFNASFDAIKDDPMAARSKAP